ncbi:hypothetical protein J5N97_013632 [Dioscorea zingiberensis]|uniref:Uncharacterized protein n=1 Tax=Dioscorea zingiberensis TaxID=325984 RepID=A0A9D5CTL8_9LILI|nr:hypothetical protein J5N97_013632 [Dioscorea zingiberensis]
MLVVVADVQSAARTRQCRGRGLVLSPRRREQGGRTGARREQAAGRRWPEKEAIGWRGRPRGLVVIGRDQARAAPDKGGQAWATPVSRSGQLGSSLERRQGRARRGWRAYRGRPGAGASRDCWRQRG